MMPSGSSPRVLHAVVGTAGHVDHGKTELVKRLTGVDTDRLPEEKARGMSIDLGFAPYAMPDGRLVGIVDVPGHKDFIRNMVAGAASMDVLVLVVAADDGVMPQTDEHMRIVQLLRSPVSMAVVTKIDLVGEARLSEVRLEVQRFMARLGLADAPLVLASSRTGENLGEVKRTLETLIDGATEADRSDQIRRRAFRMNVERVFTLRGHGTVVTGIPLAGEVDLEDRLELLPGDRQTSVRGIQTFRFDAHRASENACTALNLRDVPADSIHRGMTLVTPGAFEPTATLLGSIQNASEGIVIRRREQVRLHTGTSVTTAWISLIGIDQLCPGEQAFVRAKLGQPLVVATGDRFLLRSLTPAVTLGGGSVLTTHVDRVKGGDLARVGALAQAQEALCRSDLLGAALMASTRATMSPGELRRLTQCREDTAAALISHQEAEGSIVNLGEHWLVRARLGDLAGRLRPMLRTYHLANPYAWGMQASHICRLLDLPFHDFDGLVAQLRRYDDGIALRHGCLAEEGHHPALTDQQLQARSEIVRCVEAAGSNPPARGALRTALALSPSEMSLLVRLLSEEGLIKVLRRHLICSRVYGQCREALLGLFLERPVVDVNAFREATQTSRRVAVELLEAFDSEGLTRRVETGRVLARAKLLPGA